MVTFKKRGSKTGLEPGTLIHIGEKKVEKVKLKLVVYDSETFIEKELDSFEECIPYKDKPHTNVWLNVDGLDQTEIIEEIGNCFNIHPLTLEDVLNTGQRPKMEDYESYIYTVLKMMLLDEKNDELIIDQISIIFSYNYIISFQEREIDVLNPLRERLRNPSSRLRKYGTDHLAYSIIDTVIDNYFLILEHYGDEIEEFEDQLVTQPSPDTIRIIQRYRRDMIILRKSVWPLRELISGLQRIESEIIKDSTHIYLRDIYDHTIQVIDSIEDYRDMLSSMVDIYLSSLSNRMNDIMKVLTVIATIFIPLTFIAGVYGMNFEYMPELHWRWGYPAVMLFMFILGSSMFIYFKKRGWI